MLNESKGSGTGSEGNFQPTSSGRAPVPFLFLVLQASRPLSGGARYSLAGVSEVSIGRGKARDISRSGTNSEVLSIAVDCQSVSSRHAVLRWTREGWLISDLGSRHGIHINGQRIESPMVINDGDIITLGGSFFILGHHRVHVPADLDTEDLNAMPAGLLTLHPEYGDMLNGLRKVVTEKTAITIVGETGTGKEIMARAIHALSGRRGPYSAMSCADIAPSLISSELFGHVKGAFSGATRDNPGHIRAADLGTLLLDEILSAPPELQAALLRVMQERQVTPVGSTRPIPVDVRFLCAAQQGLGQAVSKLKFRPDLQARLQAGFICSIPPLRERMCDVGNLVAFTFREQGMVEQDDVRFTLPAALALLRNQWPLNVRELVDAVSRARHLSDGRVIDETHLPQPTALPGDRQLKAKLLSELRATNGNVAETARRLGKNRSLVHKWMRKIGVDAKRFR